MAYVIKANGMYWGNRRSGWRSFFGFGDLRNAIRYPTRKKAQVAQIAINGHGVVTKLATRSVKRKHRS